MAGKCNVPIEIGIEIVEVLAEGKRIGLYEIYKIWEYGWRTDLDVFGSNYFPECKDCLEIINEN